MISFHLNETVNQHIIYQNTHQCLNRISVKNLYRRLTQILSASQKAIVTFLFIAFLFLLSACSGGEGGTGATDPIDISQGQITEFGSIFVNGIEFDTTNVNVSLEGISGSEPDLKLGMIVTVKGAINADGITGTAESVLVEEVIRGLVQANNGSNQLMVLDQIIQVPANTRFDGLNSITELMPDVDWVEISGYVKDSGVISAVRIERLGSGLTKSTLFGNIENLDIAGTFKIGDTLIVDYAGADIIDFVNSSLSNNIFVKIEGSYDAPSNTLTATKIENALVRDIDVNEIEIEGFVTSIASPTKFFIGGTEVNVDSNTVYAGGSADEVFSGVFLEAEGTFVNGVLIAEEIEFEDEIRIEAKIVAVDTVSNSITLTGLAGLVINTDSFTEFSSEGGFNNLMAGGKIRIRAYQKDSTVIARRIDSRLSDLKISLQGFVSAIPSPNISFNLMKVAIDTKAFSDSDFSKENVAIGRDKFFAEIEIDKVVEARGSLVGSSITWESVEIID